MVTEVALVGLCTYVGIKEKYEVLKTVSNTIRN